jgi:hypothetical protein
MIQVGPDGALWIADMYRYVIEHPEWIPKNWQKKLDLRAGHELGRIYRVYPADKKPREIVAMDKMTVAELVKQFESPSGWVRDTAQQVLIAKTSKTVDDAKRAAIQLDWMAKKTKVPQARLHALYYHAAVSYVAWFNPPEEIEKFLEDPHPAIRKHALALYAEGYSIAGDWRIEALMPHLTSTGSSRTRRVALSASSSTRAP